LDGVASLFEVGLESGKITGRSTCFAISRTISSVKAPGCAEVPIRIVGRTFLITSLKVRVDPPNANECPFNGLLLLFERFAFDSPSVDQTPTVNQPQDRLAPSGAMLRNYRRHNLVADADRR
jgi:hypothetical protein